MNASLGVHEESDGYGTVLGQDGINTRNEKGVEALDLLQTHNLKAATTFHKHTKYNTWMNFCSSDQEYQIDHWITNSICLVKDAGASNLGVDSDHSAVYLELDLKRNEKHEKL